jgi:hypothetical protein
MLSIQTGGEHARCYDYGFVDLCVLLRLFAVTGWRSHRLDCCLRQSALYTLQFPRPEAMRGCLYPMQSRRSHNVLDLLQDKGS